MRSTLNKARVLMNVQFATMTAYRAEIVIWMLSGTLALIMMLVWMGQASSAAGGEIGGYSARDFASYFLSAWTVGQLMVVWVGWELDFQIRQGQLSPQLLRPIDPFWGHYLGHLAERVVRLPLMLLLIAAFALLTGARFSTDPRAYLAALLLVLLGFTVRFLWEYTFGLLAFWTDSATAVSEFNWILYFALGGMFAPLSFFPPAVQAVAAWTPFPYMVSLPARLLAGQPALNEVGHALLVLGAWLLGFGVLRGLLWRSGLRRYGAVGA